MFSGWKSDRRPVSRLQALNSAWYSMASLMDAVARMALKRRPARGGVVFGMASMTALLRDGLAQLRLVLPFPPGFEVIHVETQDVLVFDGVGDGVGVELLLEEVFGGFFSSSSFDLLAPWRCLLEDGRAGETEELGLGEESLMASWFSQLRAVAFVEDEDSAFVAGVRALASPCRSAGRFFSALLRLLFSSSARPSFWMVVTMTLST